MYGIVAVVAGLELTLGLSVGIRALKSLLI